MTPDTPGDPQKDTAAEPEQVEQPATEAKAEKAAKPRRARKAAKAQPATAKAEDGEAAAEKKAPAAKRTRAKAAPKEAAEAPPERARGERAKPRTGLRAGRKEAPATARRRVVRARARYVRTSARKARLVCGHLRGKSVHEARAILAFTPREVARDWSKLLESAVANAEANHELVEDDLVVREAYADEGPTIKRFRPRAMGRATPIHKRTSHLTITLTARAERPAKRKG
jgi:ribosomal protein L22